MQNIKQFKNDYKKLKGALSAAQSGGLSFGKIVQVYGNKDDSIDDFIKAITEIMRKYEASICMYYNLDGTVNKREFGKFYTRFISASDDDKRLYGTVNNTSYDKLLEELNGIRSKILKSEAEDDRIMAEIDKGLAQIKKGIEDRIKMKQELVEIGIAEDDGLDNIIHIIPERFVDYLKYLETHRKRI